VSLRPAAYGPLLQLSRAYLRGRDLFRAHRTLARAREADPDRFRREAAAWVGREGFDLDAVCQGPAPRRPETVAARTRRRAAEAPLVYGDCRDLDEYARFRAMPPITPAEVDSIDWDDLLGDLLDE
jgi:hypothetical protein